MGREKTYALITGGSSGIGLALAHEFAKKGHHIAIVSLPNTGQEEAIFSIQSIYGCQVKSLELNLIENGAVEKIKDWIIKENIQVQALVNNAGMGYVGSFKELDSSFTQMLIDINIKSTVLLTQALIPELKKNKCSYVLNISSAGGFYSMPFKSIYAASKRFVLDFSLALREELKDDNISVTAVCPAGVITNIEQRERIKDAGWLARESALKPEQVANAAVKAMFKEKGYVVPGFLANLMSKARFLTPKFLQRKLIAKNFKK